MPSTPASASAQHAALAAAFLGAPRSHCDFEETFEDLGDALYSKKVKVTDCEQEDCPQSVMYAPPRARKL